MDYVQFIHADKLDEEYVRIYTNEEGMVDDRRFNWLCRNMKNHVLAHSRKTIDAAFDDKVLLSTAFGIELESYITAREMLLLRASMPVSGRITFKRLDLFQLTDAQREAYLMGSAMIGFSNLREHGEKCRHLCDALEANLAHKKNWTSVTPEAADELADAWVKRLARQKLETTGAFGIVEELEGGLTLVKLLDEDAYKAEGALMHHCVASYWGGRSTIYSLREGTTRLVTIEINAYDEIVQARGPANAPPTDEQAKVLAGIYERHGWKKQAILGFRGLRGLRLDDIEGIRGPRGLQGFVGRVEAPSIHRHGFGEVFNAPQMIHLAEGVYVLDALTVRSNDIEVTYQVVAQESTVEWVHGRVRVTATVHGAVRVNGLDLGGTRIVRHGVEALLTNLEIIAHMEDLREPHRSRLTFEIPAHELQRFYQGN